MSDDEFDDDDVFEGVNADEILQSDQAPKQNGSKRTITGLYEKDGGDLELASKRVKIEHDVAYDEENTAVARGLLKEKFGYDSFRHEQEGAIKHVLSGQNTLVIFPTGAGKSLCYQVSANLALDFPPANGAARYLAWLSVNWTGSGASGSLVNPESLLSSPH